MQDIAETIHRMTYGKSGRASANTDSPEFLQGYSYGKLPGSDGAGEASDLIYLEAARRGFPARYTDAWERFYEWKRGFWAARIQKAFSEAKEEMGEDFPD